jgi:hypothetical protein
MPIIDFNFRPEQHVDELDGLTDVEVPQGWTLGRLIRGAHDARLLLWDTLNTIDGDGNIVPRRAATPPQSEEG